MLHKPLVSGGLTEEFNRPELLLPYEHARVEGHASHTWQVLRGAWRRSIEPLLMVKGQRVFL